MRNALIGAVCLIAAGFGPAIAQTTSGQPPSIPTTPPPDKRADASVPRNGVIHPDPNATADSTVKPPNVDPGMTISPPGTTGSGSAIVPK